jgi:hypothetical protein
MKPSSPQPTSPLNGLRLDRLTVEQIQQIDRLLVSLRGNGEIRLIIQRGVLKYINIIESHGTGRSVDENEE